MSLLDDRFSASGVVICLALLDVIDAQVHPSHTVDHGVIYPRVFQLRHDCRAEKKDSILLFVVVCVPRGPWLAELIQL